MGAEAKRSFTLIELLVAVSIIGLLASIVLIQLNSARKKARDAQRLSSMQTITKALMLYLDKKGQFPGPTSSYGENESACGGWDSSSADNNADGRFFITPLETEGIISKVPLDPLNTGTCGNGLAYRYYRYTAGSYGCAAARGAYFVLGINHMEARSGRYPTSPGWSCSGRNWQNEFEWVTGGFEN